MIANENKLKRLTNGWVDSEIRNPKKSGQYLCLLKWDDEGYVYQILDYDAENDNWSVTDSCEHIIWSELRKKPNV